MKRILSVFLLSVITFSAVLPLYAQKTRVFRVPKADSRISMTQFGSTNAFSEGRGVLVQWDMALEVNNGGFYVYRLDNGIRTLVSKGLINGSAVNFGEDAMPGEKYSLYDPDGGINSMYVIESLNMNGTLRSSDSFAAQYVADLRQVSVDFSKERWNWQADVERSVTESKLAPGKELAREIVENRVSADLTKHRQVISQPGVKIGVRKEGLYRVSKSQLQSAGLDVNSDPNLWQLYREGVEQAILVGPNADFIEFYGKGVDTVESDTAMYYLTVGAGAGKRIVSRPARPASGGVTQANFKQTFVEKQRTGYVGDILNGDANNYFGEAIVTVADTNFNFTLTGVDQSSQQSTMELKFQGMSYDSHIVSVVLNGHPLDSATGLSRNSFSKQYTFPTSYLNEGANALKFRSTGVFADFSFFDTVSISFAKKYLASQNRLNFFTQNYRRADLDGFSSANIRVFDITADGSPVLFSNLNPVQNGGTFGLTLPADRGRLLFAVEDSGLLQPASITANDPANLMVPATMGKLVIIAYKDFMTQAEAWANYRRGQGVNVKVVEVSEIYDEFNYGVLSANSIKSFLNYAFNNWAQTPQYVLLLGDASVDSRDYQGLGFYNFVPTKIVDTVFSETGSDEALADFNNDGLAEVAIGRIPSRDAQSITNVLAKVTAFEAAAPSLEARGTLFAFDSYDSANNYDFQQISNRVEAQLPASVPSTFVGRSDTPPPPNTPQTVLLGAMNSGKFIVNYSGHGSTGAWASASFFSNNQVPQLTNANNQSIFTMLTCLNGYFPNVVNKSLAETLLEATNGGAVATWASTGKTTPDVQELMAKRFYLKLGEGSIQRLGDLVRDAKTAINGGTDVRLSWALLGDPMLKVRPPVSGD